MIIGIFLLIYMGNWGGGGGGIRKSAIELEKPRGMMKRVTQQ